MADLSKHEQVMATVRESMIEPMVVAHSASFFKAVGDETRIRILYTLSRHEMCVNDISSVLNMTKSAVSHQLKLLKMEGLVKNRREGKNIYYSLDDEHVVEVLEMALTHVMHKMKEKNERQ